MKVAPDGVLSHHGETQRDAVRCRFHRRGLFGHLQHEFSTVMTAQAALKRLARFLQREDRLDDRPEFPSLNQASDLDQLLPARFHYELHAAYAILSGLVGGGATCDGDENPSAAQYAPGSV